MRSRGCLLPTESDKLSLIVGSVVVVSFDARATARAIGIVAALAGGFRNVCSCCWRWFAWGSALERLEQAAQAAGVGNGNRGGNGDAAVGYGEKR